VTTLGFRDGDQSLDALLDELVEAHIDTIEMLVDYEHDPSWSSHAQYLRGLVRHAKRLTAWHAADGPPAG
jgi:hypothetical protein